ncbi:MAG: serine--tRNA ligase, partial [Lachnospiraceae bacterium]|nr:serine--tRNA ligase [Lachnospiraceae bacterium]
MLDIKFVRENPDAVRENIRKKFQEEKLPLVDEVIELDKKSRETQKEADELRANRNKTSKEIGALMAQGRKEEAEAVKARVAADGERIKELEQIQRETDEALREKMLVIPQMIDDSVPIGKDDSCNVEIEKFGEPFVPAFEIPYHTDIMERLHGIDLDAARRVAGNGFYYLMGDVARLHSAVLSYARDFMIDRGFTYVIPPFMIHAA